MTKTPTYMYFVYNQASYVLYDQDLYVVYDQDFYVCMLYMTKPRMLYITKPGGALLPSSGCDGSQGPPPADAPRPIIQCNRQTKKQKQQSYSENDKRNYRVQRKQQNSTVQQRENKQKQQRYIEKDVLNNEVHQKQQNSTVHIVYFVQYDVTVSFMTLYPVQ